MQSFLKFQAQKCESHIRDAKDFIIKFPSVTNTSENNFLVTIQVSSLDSNINHEDGSETCFKKLEERKNKSILSIFIKNLILMIFKSKAF